MDTQAIPVPVHKPNKSVVLITGATGGLGKAFAVECARRGWSLFLTDLREDALDIFARSLQTTYGVPVHYQACDLADVSSRSALFEGMQARQNRFWALINVAGIDHEGLFLDQSRGQIRAIIRLNVEGTLEMCHGALPLRDPQQAFRIINVASLAAFYPMPVKATYAASKRFILDFSLALREEVRELGATVTVLCPGGLPTTAEVVEAIEAQGLPGFITTVNTGTVAAMTLDAALRGEAVVIPGWFNRSLQILGGLAPDALVTRFIGARWRQARKIRKTSVEFPARQREQIPTIS
jgi:hypothetical protein